MTVRELMSEYLWALEDEGKSAAKIRSQVRFIIEFLGDVSILRLNALDLENYRVRRRKMCKNCYTGKPPAHSTINRELTYLRAALTRARDLEVIERVPKIRMRPETNVRQDFVTPDRWAAVLGYLRGRSPPVADAVELLGHTGWRKREVLGLEWVDVNLEAQTIQLAPERAKNRAPRVYPLEGRPLRLIQRRERERLPGVPWVFHRGGRAMADFRKLWKQAKHAAGCESLTVHGLRRTLARNHLLAGVPREITKRLAGWKTDIMYERYAVTTEPDLRRALRGVSERFGFCS